MDVPVPPGAVLLGLGGVNRLVHAAKDVRGHVNHPPLPDGTTSGIAVQLGMQQISRFCPKAPGQNIGIFWLTLLDTKMIQIYDNICKSLFYWALNFNTEPVDTLFRNTKNYDNETAPTAKSQVVLHSKCGLKCFTQIFYCFLMFPFFFSIENGIWCLFLGVLFPPGTQLPFSHHRHGSSR